jgi:hypothetical protein
LNHLVPCPDCRRHVRVSEGSCPFCSAVLDLAGVPAPVLPTRRLGRAQLFAFGATLAASITGTACGGVAESDKGTGGAAGSASGGSGGSGGSAGGGAGGKDAGFGGDAGSPGLMYGIPPDAGSSLGGGGGAQPVYGAAPPDEGETE